jgi:hypothetical protein
MSIYGERAAFNTIYSVLRSQLLQMTSAHKMYEDPDVVTLVLATLIDDVLGDYDPEVGAAARVRVLPIIMGIPEHEPV